MNWTSYINSEHARCVGRFLGTKMYRLAYWTSHFSPTLPYPIANCGRMMESARFLPSKQPLVLSHLQRSVGYLSALQQLAWVWQSRSHRLPRRNVCYADEYNILTAHAQLYSRIQTLDFYGSGSENSTAEGKNARSRVHVLVEGTVSVTVYITS